jgi:hypothetical protein
VHLHPLVNACHVGTQQQLAGWQGGEKQCWCCPACKRDLHAHNTSVTGAGGPYDQWCNLFVFSHWHHPPICQLLTAEGMLFRTGPCASG